MRLEAHLTTADLQHAFFQLTPVTVLDPDSPHRQLSIKPPSDVQLIEGLGLRIVSEVQLQWDVIGVRLPVTLRRVELVLTPTIESQAGEEVLAFALRIEDADLSAIPAFLREVLVARVNGALNRPDARIAWRFMDTLDFHFDLPPSVRPRFHARLFARAGEVEVTDGALRLAIEWGVSADADRNGANTDEA
jgi:hypothetical protein